MLVSTEAKPRSTYADPMRLYDRPAWRDVWCIVGLILTVPDLIVALLVVLRADFAWGLAGSALGGWWFLLGRTIGLFLVGSLVPVLIRRSIRRGKLSVKPVRTEPGFYADPIRKNSQRYWDGTQWTAELRQPYKRETGRMIFLCSIFFAISLLLSLGFSMRTLAGERVAQAYSEAGTALTVLDEGLQAAAAGGTVPTSLVDAAQQLPAVARDLESAVQAYPRRDGDATTIEEVPVVQYEGYVTGYAALAAAAASAAGTWSACPGQGAACSGPELAAAVSRLSALVADEQALAASIAERQAARE